MQNVITEEAAKAKAKALRAALADKGVELNHQACLDVISRVEGEKGWSALNAKQNQVSAKAPAAKKILGFSEVLDSCVFDYEFDVNFYNPEGNRIHQELYLTLDDARQVQAEWRMQGSGWSAELFVFRWVSGVAVYPEKKDSSEFRFPVEFTRQDGSKFTERFESESEACREADRWSNFSDPDVKGQYLGEEPLPDVVPPAAPEKALPAQPAANSFEPPLGWKPSYSPWRHGGWYVSNVQYPSGAVGCVSNNYPDGKWRIVCDERRDDLGGPDDFTFATRDAAARAEYDMAARYHAAAANGATKTN